MRILIFSDIHSNKYAMREVMKEKFDEAIFLGDIVDYGPDPSETIDMVRSTAKYMVMGNHDFATAFNRDCLCSEENHELSVYTRENITLKELGKEDINFLRKIPENMDIKVDGITLSLVHGSPSDHLYGYLYPWNISKENFRTPFGSYVDEGMILVGHTHFQFLLPFGKITLLNPGSAGQPRDNDVRPSYSIIDTNSGIIEMKRFDYDRESLNKAISEKVTDRVQRNKLLNLFRSL